MLAATEESASQHYTATETRAQYGTELQYPDNLVTFRSTTLSVGPAHLEFMRTLRVPDNTSKYLLPPVRPHGGIIFTVSNA
jgi:hypothetical protein